MIQSTLWKRDQLSYILEIRIELVKEFKSKFKIDLYNQYYQKGKLIYNSYIIPTEKLSDIKKWLKKDKPNKLKIIK